MPDQYDDATLRKLLKDEGHDWDAKEKEFETRLNGMRSQGQPSPRNRTGLSEPDQRGKRGAANIQGRGNIQSSFLPSSLPGPAAIVALAVQFGFNIPWGKIVRYLLCVLEGIWTQPLPDAAKACAAKWGEPIDAAKKK
jgi:hypothetical protein